MDFNDYQVAAARTATYAKDDKEYKLMLLSMGLAGESGEAIDKIKKLVNNEGGVLSDEKRTLLLSEFGDVLWYLSQLAVTLDSSLEEVAQINIAKLADRARRGMIVKGEGDNR